ncbi:hypothetical protein DIZ81_06210 [Legionella taurinensis]|uniref:Uncharacterized protein n=1 Tax=Legionella taurinensis TaxID=70611 RepID=A0A3A5LCK9_9GAMM|nr:hypothetical protein [Legionella taurinensis]MDX1837512.1 hypothetical protein [Legionella taurinensis]PUT40852.1 hypothetical protein DB744_06210 [Legionella taurinensis]PUT44273.1 hypothetical protein DB746_04610 [Legionella taurinensis]PUT47575.1 hypothetical protein DB743_02780 [Legionella taurinensis]PUT48714.1 hypothetical protein DB745_04610 [Legionella taurinensis]
MKLLTELEGFITGKISLVKTLVSLIRLEARLAGQSVYPLLVNACLLLTLLITTWATVAVLIGYGLLLVSGSLIVTLLLILFIHLALLALSAGRLKTNLHRMSFARTRHYLNAPKDKPHARIPQKTD